MPRGVYVRTAEYRAKMSEAQKGKTLAPEHKAKIGEANKGRPSPYKGKSRSPDFGRKISAALTGKPLPPDHPKRQLKANVSYFQLHKRVKKARGPARNYPCEGGCQGTADEWATIHGRDGLDVYLDYVPLCHRCHCEYDQENRTAARRARARPQRLDQP